MRNNLHVCLEVVNLVLQQIFIEIVILNHIQVKDNSQYHFMKQLRLIRADFALEINYTSCTENVGRK